jgi:hypothetical protein
VCWSLLTCTTVVYEQVFVRDHFDRYPRPVTSEPPRTAYVDESLRPALGLCVLVSAAIALAKADEARREVRAVLLPGQPRFHWRDETDAQRRRMLDAVTTVSPLARVFVCRARGRRQDRARAKCILRMTWDLAQDGVDQVLLESRGDGNDKKDARTIGQAKRAGSASAALSFGFSRPHTEPLLWIPDALAGAAAAQAAGERSDFLDSLPKGFLTLTEVEP